MLSISIFGQHFSKVTLVYDFKNKYTYAKSKIQFLKEILIKFFFDYHCPDYVKLRKKINKMATQKHIYFHLTTLISSKSSSSG